MDDAQLGRKLLAGDPRAFDEFVETYHNKIFRYSYAMCRQREDAEEVAQETLLKVFESLPQLREPDRLKPWVFRIAKNACLMMRRKSIFAPKEELPLDELPAPLDHAPLPDHLAENEELRAALDRAVAELPQLYRAVFLLRDREDLSTQDTAEILGISEDVVKTRLHRARLAMRKGLEAYAGAEHEVVHPAALGAKKEGLKAAYERGLALRIG